MGYSPNPFLERMSERTTSDLDFVRLFSPKIIDRLVEDAFEGAVHVFRSAPGGGKSTLLRAFTPPSLRAFWHSRHSPDVAESAQKLIGRGILTERDRPQFLGVMLSCASGYADIPPSDGIRSEGVFRALMDCRIVLRTLRSLGALMGYGAQDSLSDIALDVSQIPTGIKGIPTRANAQLLLEWAEDLEQKVCAQLDSLSGAAGTDLPTHLQFEGVVWLQSIQFVHEGRIIAPKRLLMIDDVQRLRRNLRRTLIDELTVQRSQIPVWLAERTVALGTDVLLSQGAREGRDLRVYSLDDMWSSAAQFAAYAQSITDRRMANQDAVAARSFAQCLRADIVSSEVTGEISAGVKRFREEVRKHVDNARFSEWLERAESFAGEPELESLIELYVTRILMARDVNKKQMSFDLTLTTEELEERDSSSVRGAAEIFIHEELKIPYYYGFERLCIMATNNVDELLSLAAALYSGMLSRQVLGKAEPNLSPTEQEALVRKAASQRMEFIPKQHTQGTRARRLLESIGAFCISKTFAPSAPYAPGVTGIRLSRIELDKLTETHRPLGDAGLLLAKVMGECVGENLLFRRESSASASRDSGTIFYLNRSICAYFGLPLQMGGWQDVSVGDLMKWMERPFVADQPKLGIQ